MSEHFGTAWMSTRPMFREHTDSGVHHHVDQTDLSEGLPMFATDSFDTVLCISTLAYLTKAAGLRLIKEAERGAKKRVVLQSPLLKELRRHGRANEGDVSLWSRRELKDLGYSLKPSASRRVQGVFAGRRFLLYFYGGTLLAQLLPQTAGEVLAVRDVRPRA